VVTICTASLTFNNSTFCPHSVFMCFVWISQQTAIISLYNINWMICITEAQSVYCAVRTGCLYTTRLNQRPWNSIKVSPALPLFDSQCSFGSPNPLFNHLSQETSKFSPGHPPHCHKQIPTTLSISFPPPHSPASVHSPSTQLMHFPNAPPCGIYRNIVCYSMQDSATVCHLIGYVNKVITVTDDLTTTSGFDLHRSSSDCS
jgi:hypothetical protein